MERTKRSVLIALASMCLIACAILGVRFIADGYGGTLYWKGDEAYFFTSDSHRGYQVSYLAFPFELLAQNFFWAPLPSEQWGCSLVIQITPSNVERYPGACGGQNVQDANFLTPFDDGFYAMCQGAILCKWTVHGYVPARPEEKQRLDGGNSLIAAPQNDQLINGWRVHHTPGSPGVGSHFEVSLSDGSVISVTNRATDVGAYPWITVDLVRPGQKPQSLFNVDGSPRWVSKKEYVNTFNSSASRFVD
jgi:hypothetical protein